MEASASVPSAPHIEPEPSSWQPRATWVSARLLCGSISFFFVSFVFAYFYLRSLDTNDSWKIGPVNPSIGLGTMIMAALLLSAVIFRVTAKRPELGVLGGGIIAILLALTAFVLQIIEWTTLGFGPASGGYASVFVGWTAMYVLFILFGLYWMETQVASLWRRRREGGTWAQEEGVAPTDELVLMQAGLEACSFYWAYFVAIGVLAYVILYLV